MTIIQFILAFISAFGLGAIVQTYISQRADTKKRNFQEKKEAYVGYLDAFYKSGAEGTKEAACLVGHWRMRIELVGSKEVIESCMLIEKTNPTNDGDHPDRPKALKMLKEDMRSDLSVAGE